MIDFVEHVALSSKQVPKPALLLGAGGALPFIGLTGAQMFGWMPGNYTPAVVMANYGATILAFMGAVHWGLAMAADVRAERTGSATNSYVVSVIPALVGWAALSFLPVVLALRTLAAAFLVLAIYDTQLASRGLLPDWYPRLRWPLTAVVVPSLLLASLVA